MSQVLADIKKMIKKEFPDFQDEVGEIPILNPVDQGAIALLSELKHGPLKFSPLLVEPLLDEAIMSLNRCLAQRSATQEIEEQAITDVINYEYLKKELALNVSINKLQSEFDGLSQMISKQLKLKVSEGNIIPDPGSVDALRAFEDQLLAIDKKKNELIIERVEKLKKLRGVSGNALNLLERFNLSKEVFNLELKEAYARLKAVSVGLKEVYDIQNLPLPELSDTGYLNKLYLYAIETINRLHEILQYEQEFMLSIPLKVGYAKGGTVIKIYQSDDVFTNQCTAGTLKFDLPEQLLAGYKYLRLRAIKLAVRVDVHQNPERWNCKVNVPEQRGKDGNIIWEIPDYNTVALNATNPGFIYDNTRDLTIYNCSLKGEWTITLPRQSSRSNGLIGHAEDIWLELLVSGRVL